MVRRDIFASFLILGGETVFFTIKFDVSGRFFKDAVYQVNGISSYFKFAECFYEKGILDFIYGFPTPTEESIWYIFSFWLI